MGIKVMKPTSFEDSQDICDVLLAGKATIINLEGFNVDLAQRVMDFISVRSRLESADTDFGESI